MVFKSSSLYSKKCKEVAGFKVASSLYYKKSPKKQFSETLFDTALQFKLLRGHMGTFQLIKMI